MRFSLLTNEIFILFTEYCLEYIPWLMRIIFRHFPLQKNNELTSKMKMKNLPFSEDFVSMEKYYHIKNPQALGNSNMYLVFRLRHFLCPGGAINDTLVTKKARDRNRQIRGFEKARLL